MLVRSVKNNIPNGLEVNLKERLDRLLVQRGLCPSREQARALIMAGEVLVNEQCIDKAGTLVPSEANVRLKKAPLRYVSRGGLKLEAALDVFSFDPSGLFALDLGASTGGFTDCLLQRGARKIVAVDVGYGQLHHSLRSDPRVVCLEKLNARFISRDALRLEPHEKFQLVVGDLSFISLRLVLEPVVPLLEKEADCILLIKPQFEAGREFVGKGGVVRDDAIRQSCADQVSHFASCLGLEEKGRLDSPVIGPKGNIEILMWFHFNGE